MKQALLSIFCTLLLLAAFSQPKPKKPKTQTKADTARAVKPITPADSLGKIYFYRTSTQQLQGMASLFETYNADDLTTAGKTKVWNQFLSLFTLDSTYKPKK